jgi:hypothetical protein
VAQLQRDNYALTAKLEAARREACAAQSLATQLEEARIEVAAAKALAAKLAEDAAAAQDGGEAGRGRSAASMQQAWGLPLFRQAT